ncbi:MAG: hypothetical protein ACR2HO_00695 [Rubrobacteraceae bacterium]
MDGSLADLQLARKKGLAVVTLEHESGATITHGDTVPRRGDVMVIVGDKKDLDGFDLLQK